MGDLLYQLHHHGPKSPEEALDATLAFIEFWGRRILGGSRELLGRVLCAGIGVFKVVANEIKLAG